MGDNYPRPKPKKSTTITYNHDKIDEVNSSEDESLEIYDSIELDKE